MSSLFPNALDVNTRQFTLCYDPYVGAIYVLYVNVSFIGLALFLAAQHDQIQMFRNIPSFIVIAQEPTSPSQSRVAYCCCGRDRANHDKTVTIFPLLHY